MKKIFSLSIIYLFLFLTSHTTAQEKVSILTEYEKAWVKSQDTVYFGYDPSWKPYQFINSKGEHDGIMNDILMLITERSGLNLQPFPNLTWQSSITALKEHKIQLIPCLTASESRRKFMSFTSNYMSFPFVIVGAKNEKFIGGMEDLEDCTLAMPLDYNITEVIERNYPSINILYNTTVEETLLSVVTNKADATIASLPVISYYLTQRGFDHLKIAQDFDEFDLSYCMSVNIGNDTLLSILNKSINSISINESNEIINKWVTVTYDHGINMSTVRKLSLISIFLISIILIWNYTLKREINDRKTVEYKLLISNNEVLAQKNLVEKVNKEITDNINYAKRIQYAMLPPPSLVKSCLKNSFILYKPKDIVAGDFYWLETVDNHCLFAVADCTGHGVSGAFISIICHNALNRSVHEFKLSDPGKILDKVRELVIETFDRSDLDVQDGMDIALCSYKAPSKRKEEEKIQLQYSGANNPLWLIQNGKLVEIKANKEPIGSFENSHPYTTHSFELSKGDTLYLFSDGYVDQFGGPKEKKFKYKAFRELLLNLNNNSMNEQKVILNETFEKWQGNLEQVDDVCVMGVKI